MKRYTLQLREREEHFRELAHTDPLTGLANRRGLVRALREPDPDGRPRFLVGIDLDGFKNVNDMRGHDVGDAVLAEVGDRLRRNLLAGDVAARLGGDEFAVLMHATAGRGDAGRQAAARGARRAVRGGRRLGLPVGQRRGGRQPGAGRHRRADARRRPGPAVRQAARQEPGRAVRGPLRRAAAPPQHAGERAAARDRARRAAPGVPAGGGAAVDAPGRRRGAAALAPPDAGQRAAGRVHPGRRGVRADQPARRLGAAAGLPAARRVAGRRARRLGVGEPVAQGAARGRLRRARSPTCWPSTAYRRSGWCSR